MSQDPVIVFNHIPKCYGTSVRKFFRQFTTPLADYRATFASEEDFTNFPYDVSVMGGEDFLLGHFNSEGNHLPKRYPEVWKNERFRLFTFFREPLDMQISLYYYTLKKKPQVAEKNPERFETLETYLRRTYNSMASALPCTAEDFREVLERYFFLGVTDRHEESLTELVARMRAIYAEAEGTRSVLRVRRGLEKLSRIELPHENKTSRDTQAENLSDETLEIFRERNSLDYEVYRYACAELDRAKGASS